MGAAAQLKNLYNQILNGTAPSGSASASGDLSQMVKYLVNLGPAPIPAGPFISTADLRVGGLLVSAPASATWPTANKAILCPFVVTKPITAVKLWILNGATASGNWDVGIYDSAFAKTVAIGSTAQAGVSTIQEFDIADTALDVGVYYFAAALDNTTGTYTRMSASAVSLGQVVGGVRMTSAFPLPATITPAAISTDSLPIMGLSTRTVVA